MHSILLVLIILLTETSLSFAQGHMGTPQEQQVCRRDVICSPMGLKAAMITLGSEPERGLRN